MVMCTDRGRRDAPCFSAALRVLPISCKPRKRIRRNAEAVNLDAHHARVMTATPATMSAMPAMRGQVMPSPNHRAAAVVTMAMPRPVITG